MKYQSVNVNEDGTRVENRNTRKSQRTKVFLHNKKLVSIARKARKEARQAEADAQSENTESN